MTRMDKFHLPRKNLFYDIFIPDSQSPAKSIHYNYKKLHGRYSLLAESREDFDVVHANNKFLIGHIINLLKKPTSK